METNNKKQESSFEEQLRIFRSLNVDTKDFNDKV